MKTLYITILALLLSLSAFCQAPTTIKYQAVIRDANGQVMANTDVHLVFTILPSVGSQVYGETQDVTTNQFGLVSLEIGAGEGAATFSAIDWSQGGYSLKVDLDGDEISNNIILAVPYALHAKTVENISEDDLTNISNLSGVNTGDQDLSSYATKDMAGSKISNLGDPTNEQDAATKAYVDLLEKRIAELELLVGFDLVDERDGAHYKTVKIGGQIWMAENLKYLPSVVGQGTYNYQTPYCYVYGYNGTDVTAAKATDNYVTYGVLYNWPAAMNGESGSATNPSGVQGVCPSGWHIPSDAEWTELTDYLGGASTAATKLKEAGTEHWRDPEGSAPEPTNESGFAALPGGYGGIMFGSIGEYGYWWSSTDPYDGDAYYREMVFDSPYVYDTYTTTSDAYSIRCVKD